MSQGNQLKSGPLKLRLPGRIVQKSSSCESTVSAADCSRSPNPPIHPSRSVSSEEVVRPRKRKTFLVRDAKGVNSFELSEVSAASQLIEVPSFKRIRGHCFISASLRLPTWCDSCGDFIWGVYKQCLICMNCHFTCHHECHSLVVLDCSQPGQIVVQSRLCETSFNEDASKVDNRVQSEECFLQRSPSKRRWIFDNPKAQSYLFNEGVIVENEDDSGYHTGNSQLLGAKQSPGARTLSREDCRRRISMFNSNNHGLVMNPPMGECETFQGSVRVHMNLTRPINMSISLSPPTIFDVHQANDTSSSSVQMTSFYLPKETSKVIHITSIMTTPEVIQVLLSKFHITDNARKFALYEKILETGKTVTMRRVRDEEFPLQICLSWADDGIDRLDCNQFVLQDYDTGEILWEAFSLPELESFLTVLNREESEYIEQVRTKYRLLKVQLAKKLKDAEPKAELATSCGKRKPVFV